MSARCLLLVIPIMCKWTNLLRDSFKGLFESTRQAGKALLPSDYTDVDYVLGLKSEIGAVSFSRNKALPIEGGLLKSGKVMLSPVSIPCIAILFSNKVVRLWGALYDDWAGASGWLSVEAETCGQG